MTLVRLMQTKLKYSNSAIMRLLKQGAVRVNGVTIFNANPEIDLSKKVIINIGKTKQFEL